MIGLAKKEKWEVIKYVFLVPFYWLMMGVSAVIAFYQLLVKPHYWEKTHHGLHIKQAAANAKPQPSTASKVPSKMGNLIDGIKDGISAFKRYGLQGSALLIIATCLANLLNFVYNAYLSRNLSLEDFGTIGLIGSFALLASIPLNSLTRTVAYKSGKTFGKYKILNPLFSGKVRRGALLVGTAFTLIWIISTPLLSNYFQTQSGLSLMLIAPIWVVGVIYAVDYGLLEGNLKYGYLALLLTTESASKLLATWLLIVFGLNEYVYAAIPISLLATITVSTLILLKFRESGGKVLPAEESKFPSKFFTTSMLIKFSAVAFLSVDVILAKHFLSPEQAGGYTMVSLIGKMIFFTNGLFSQFITSIVSNDLGANRESKKTFAKILALSAFSSTLAYLVFGLFGYITAPILLGEKILPFVNLLWIYGLGMLLFSMSSNLISFNQIQNKYAYSIISFGLSLLQIGSVYLFHRDINQIVWVMAAVGALNFAITLLLPLFEDKITTFERTIVDVIDFFNPLPFEYRKPEKGGLRILIFNWRDTKHIWSGGAEVYLNELSKEFISKGHQVTLFCSNDNHNPPYEEIDGIKIVRKGGFMTVYAWAVLFYLFKFRGNHDVIIDSENGIPFFTPLYAKEPVIGLIHHVHQDIILKELNVAWYLLPLALAAKILETRVMPKAYRNSLMITVSESSRKDMERIGFADKTRVEIINPGVELEKFKTAEKTPDPTILYLGRLKSYKSIDTAIKAMKTVVELFPNAKLKIAGFGEDRPELEKLTKNLKIEENVEFLGKVPEEEKVKLLAESWVLVYPSAWEGWGITAIEANASGTPVVASNVPGLRDSVSNPHSGYLVEYKNPNHFAEKICKILEDTNLRESLNKTSLEWAQNYTWKKSANKLLELIKEIV
uniref:Glycosyltransferase n=1 Tax=candidate division WWE3 bacterium TaxID=2053526 RepID=A0A7C4XSS3_UNCKA